MTSTEIVVQRIREAGVVLEGSVFRVQPKITGCEERSALCMFLGPECKLKWFDAKWEFGHDKGYGIDLLDTVKDLANCDTGKFSVERNSSDSFLWVFVNDK